MVNQVDEKGGKVILEFCVDMLDMLRQCANIKTLAFNSEAPRVILPPLPEFVVSDVRLPSPDVAFFMRPSRKPGQVFQNFRWDQSGYVAACLGNLSHKPG